MRDSFSPHPLSNQEDRLHPIVAFALMWMMNAGAVLLFAYMLFEGFSIIGTLLLVFLVISWWMTYRTT